MNYKSKYFKAHEYVPPDIYKRRGDKSFELIDSRVLITMDRLRELLGKPITINNYYWGGDRTQSGLRTRSFYKSDKEYSESLSQHKFGRACDFLVKGMTAKEVREFIYDHLDEFPYITFIETDISWCHLDVRNGEFRVWSPSRGFVDK